MPKHDDKFTRSKLQLVGRIRISKPCVCLRVVWGIGTNWMACLDEI